MIWLQNKKDINELSKLIEDRCLIKKLEVQEEKVDEESRSNIHQRSNVTTIESIIDKENGVDKRRNIMKNIKLKEYVILWKKEKDKNYKKKKKEEIKH